MEIKCIAPDTCIQRELKGTTGTVGNGITHPMAPAKTPMTNEDIKEENVAEHLRKIFVGGLSTHTTAATVRKYFEQFGVVSDALVMRDPVTNHSRGFGFVTFVESRSVDNVQDHRPHCIDNKNVETKRALPRHDFIKGGTGGGRAFSAASCGMGMVGAKTGKIFLGGLKDCHDEKSICDYFSQFGKISNVKLLLDRETGRMRGFGFLEFENPLCAERALVQSKHSINLNTVEVKKSTQKPYNSNRVRFAVGGAARAGYIPPQPATMDCYAYNNNYNPYLAQSALPPSAYINGWAAYVTPDVSLPATFNPYVAANHRQPAVPRSHPIPSQPSSAFGPETWAAASPRSNKFPVYGWTPGKDGYSKTGHKHALTSTNGTTKSAAPEAKIDLGAGGDGIGEVGAAVAKLSIGTGTTGKKWPTDSFKIFKPAQNPGQLFNVKIDDNGSPPTYGV